MYLTLIKTSINESSLKCVSSTPAAITSTHASEHPRTDGEISKQEGGLQLPNSGMRGLLAKVGHHQCFLPPTDSSRLEGSKIKLLIHFSISRDPQ